MFGINSDPGIFDPEYNKQTLLECRNPDLTATGSILQGIAQQVQQNLTDPIPVRHHGGKVNRHILDQLNPFSWY